MPFQSTQPKRAATCKKCNNRSTPGYLNPRSPNGLRPIPHGIAEPGKGFQSTQPEWAATDKHLICKPLALISIHAARMGCDSVNGKRHYGSTPISIHAARMGCDLV